ncbi:MAG: 6-phosphogluconolactonase [Chloroflexota bacterium]
MTTPQTPDNWDNIKILPDKDNLVRFTAERIVRIASATLEVNDRFSIALAGGSTPEPVYRMLGDTFADTLDWSRIHIFFGDERCVPPDHDESNYKMVKATLLDHIAIPTENIHRIKGEDDPQAAAEAYAKELESFFADEEGMFDLNLLGMGGDAHTASLFPGTPAVHEKDALMIAHHVEAKGNLWRISQTFPTILQSGNIMFLVSGEGKAEALKHVIEGDYEPDTYPSQVIVHSDHQHIIWAIDQAAASQLS